MRLIDFLDMFYFFGTDITRLALWQNGKCIASKDIGDTRFIKPKYRNATVKKFTLPKRRHTLLVILEDKEEK